MMGAAILMLAACSGAPFINPPQTLQSADLVGVWKVRYGSWGSEWGSEELTLNADGSFEQTYRGLGVPEAARTTKSRQSWWLEPLEGGFVRLHLPGLEYNVSGYARYAYLQFRYDPFVHESVEVNHELILQVRQDSSGELLLHHLVRSADEGFPLFDGESLIYRRKTTP